MNNDHSMERCKRIVICLCDIDLIPARLYYYGGNHSGCLVDSFKPYLLISKGANHGYNGVRRPGDNKQTANRNGSFCDPHFSRLSVRVVIAS